MLRIFFLESRVRKRRKSCSRRELIPTQEEVICTHPAQQPGIYDSERYSCGLIGLKRNKAQQHLQIQLALSGIPEKEKKTEKSQLNIYFWILTAEPDQTSSISRKRIFFFHECNLCLAHH